LYSGIGLGDLDSVVSSEMSVSAGDAARCLSEQSASMLSVMFSLVPAKEVRGDEVVVGKEKVGNSK